MNNPPDVIEAASWDELTAAARAFTHTPLGPAWDALERAALRRAIARIQLTGERAKSCADVVLLLEQLCDEDVVDMLPIELPHQDPTAT